MSSLCNSGGCGSQALAVCANRQRYYHVILNENLLQTGIRQLAENIGSRQALIVTTPTVFRLYGSELQRGLESVGCSAPMLVLRCTERSKTMREVEYISSEAYRHGLGRNAVLIGIGGGVCTDLVTMAASLVRRGIGCIRVPTTLIGQVDAGVGVKGAVNMPQKKSALGCFYAPDAVFIEPSFLKTLSFRHISSGIAEIIKVALVRDKSLFCLLERHLLQLLDSRFSSPHDESRTVLWGSVTLMLEELSRNLYEDQGYQRLMDFGHTLSPLLEVRSKFRLSHGEAVAIDMAFTIALASQLGALADEDRDRALSVIASSSLPLRSGLLTEALCMESFREATVHRGGAFNFVLPTSLGRAEFIKHANEIPSSLLRSALKWLASAERNTFAPGLRLSAAHGIVTGSRLRLS
jgi:3-dehydroquinate synthetase